MHNNDLLNLLNRSRTVNQTHDITGMLLYIEGQFFTQKEGRFIQVIEGGKKDVETIYKKIRQDKRHKDLIVIQHGDIQNRNFSNWTMGFKAVQLDAYIKLPGYFELDNNILSTNFQKLSSPLNFLKSFYTTKSGEISEIFVDRKQA